MKRRSSVYFPLKYLSLDACRFFLFRPSIGKTHLLTCACSNRALQEIFKSQTSLRLVMKNLLELLHQQVVYTQQKADLKGDALKAGQAKEQARQQALMHRLQTLSSE